MKKNMIGFLMALGVLVITPAMAGSVTSVGAIYLTATGELQRVFVPSFDDAEIAKQYVAPNETLVLLPVDDLKSGGVPVIRQKATAHWKAHQ